MDHDHTSMKPITCAAPNHSIMRVLKWVTGSEQNLLKDVICVVVLTSGVPDPQTCWAVSF